MNKCTLTPTKLSQCGVRGSPPLAQFLLITYFNVFMKTWKRRGVFQVTHTPPPSLPHENVFIYKYVFLQPDTGLRRDGGNSSDKTFCSPRETFKRFPLRRPFLRESARRGYCIRTSLTKAPRKKVYILRRKYRAATKSKNTKNTKDKITKKQQ